MVNRKKANKKAAKSKVPIVIIDPALEKDKDKIYFPEKLEQANEMLKHAKLPKLK